MKKFLMALCATLPLTALASSTDYSGSSPFNGFYGGAQAGMTTGWFSHNSTSTLTAVKFFGAASPTFTIPVSDSTSNIAPSGGLHLGYGHAFKRFYLGGEINGTLMTVKADSHSIPSAQLADSYTTSEFTTKIQNTYGFDLKPGVLLTPTLLLYLKGGMQWTHAEGSSSTTYQPIPDITEETYVGSVKGSSTLSGWQAGLGIEKRYSNHFSLYAEDLVAEYGEFSSSNVQTISGPGLYHGSQITNKTSFRPWTNMLNVGFSYYLT